MQTINAEEAKECLPQLLDRAAKGEEIVIAQSGKPLARLVGYSDTQHQSKPPQRQGGQWKGRVWMSDDFDAPLPPDIQAAFEGRGP